jgi:hypothetical protein
VSLLPNAGELRQFVEEEHAVMRERDLALPRAQATADQRRHAGGMVRRAERAAVVSAPPALGSKRTNNAGDRACLPCYRLRHDHRQTSGFLCRGRGTRHFPVLSVVSGPAGLVRPVNAFVVSGLVKRRAELAGEIERTHEALRKMVLDLENLDATILQFEPNFPAIRAER